MRKEVPSLVEMRKPVLNGCECDQDGASPLEWGVRWSVGHLLTAYTQTVKASLTQSAVAVGPGASLACLWYPLAIPIITATPFAWSGQGLLGSLQKLP